MEAYSTANTAAIEKSFQEIYLFVLFFLVNSAFLIIIFCLWYSHRVKIWYTDRNLQMQGMDHLDLHFNLAYHSSPNEDAYLILVIVPAIIRSLPKAFLEQYALYQVHCCQSYQFVETDVSLFNSRRVTASQFDCRLYVRR